MWCRWSFWFHITKAKDAIWSFKHRSLRVVEAACAVITRSKFSTILHMALRWQQQNENQISSTQQSAHTSPSRVRYGVHIKRIWKKIDRVITVPHSRSYPMEHAHVCFARELSDDIFDAIHNDELPFWLSRNNCGRTYTMFNLHIRHRRTDLDPVNE